MSLYKLSLISVLLLFSCTACAAGKSVHVKLQVVDQKQRPVADAKVILRFLLSHGANVVKEYTDPDGRINTTEHGIFGQQIYITKQGYYESLRRTGYGDQDLTLELREIKNPIAMYVKKPKDIWLVVKGEYGYDLKVGDFVMPNGIGKVSDLLINITGQSEDRWNYSYFYEIRFSNSLDGFVPFYITDSDDWRSEPESIYKSNYLAPETGYINKWDYKSILHGLKSKLDSTFNKTRNYYFRVRTKVDDDGNIESAHYGKIYGEFPRITHYFNPTPNDRNIEFDQNRNLNRERSSRGVFKP